MDKENEVTYDDVLELERRIKELEERIISLEKCTEKEKEKNLLEISGK